MKVDCQDAFVGAADIVEFSLRSNPVSPFLAAILRQSACEVPFIEQQPPEFITGVRLRSHLVALDANLNGVSRCSSLFFMLGSIPNGASMMVCGFLFYL